MRSQVRRKMDMAARVHEFATANPTPDTRHQTAVKRFDDHLAEAERLLVRQRDGRLVAKSAGARRRQLRRELTDTVLRHLVSVAEQAGKGNPDAFAAFRVPGRSLPHLAFLTAVRSMLEAAKDRVDLLAQNGLGENLLADLEKGLVELEKLNATVFEARRDHIGATSELETSVNELRELVGLLDGIYRYRFADSPDQMAAWNAARNVVGPFRTKAPVTPAPEGKADKAA